MEFPSNVFDDVRNKFFCDVECFDCNERKPQTMYISNRSAVLFFSLNTGLGLNWEYFVPSLIDPVKLEQIFLTHQGGTYIYIYMYFCPNIQDRWTSMELRHAEGNSKRVKIHELILKNLLQQNHLANFNQTRNKLMHLTVKWTLNTRNSEKWNALKMFKIVCSISVPISNKLGRENFWV